MEAIVSRRKFLAAALATTGAVCVAGCKPAAVSTGEPTAPPVAPTATTVPVEAKPTVTPVC